VTAHMSARGQDAPATQGVMKDRELILAARLARAVALLSARLEALEKRLQDGDEAAWDAYLAALQVLSALLPNLTARRDDRLLTSGEMAARLGISVKTLLRKKANGALRPALELGQRGRAALRWRGV